MATQQQFDFAKHNAMMLTANTGLKVYLAERMLLEVQAVMIQFKNPLAKELMDVTAELSHYRELAKKASEARAKSVADLTPPEASTSADGGAITTEE
jgi:hypothetical protein